MVLCHHKHTAASVTLLLALQTRYGGALAIPLFIALAQNRSLNIVGVDRGVGSFQRKPAEDRIRIVSGRYDCTNKLMIQVSSLPLSRTLLWLPCTCCQVMCPKALGFVQ